MAGINGLGASFNNVSSAHAAEDRLNVAMRVLDDAKDDVARIMDPMRAATRDEKITVLAELFRVLDVAQDGIDGVPFATAQDAQDVVDATYHSVFGVMAKERITEGEVRAHVHHYMSSTGGRMISPGFSRRFDA